MMVSPQIAIIGAGLAGCETAWQLASRGCTVVLFEMRPSNMTPAHRTDLPAELVCSNSFKSLEPSNAHGLLKAELESAGSIILQTAKNNAVPAGAALAVDREFFSQEIKKQLLELECLEYRQNEIHDILPLLEQFSIVVIAAGPLMSESLSHSLKRVVNDKGLFFYDAIAPVVFAESINTEIAFKASRYDKGEADYINCPLSEPEYYTFIGDLLHARKVPFKKFEQARHFEGCLPVEVMAERGPETLSFGPMKPVGLIDPRTGKRPWAVLQLRQEDKHATLYNLVGCQTRMVQSEQCRVFRKIPGLESCEFARYGSMHRNTYLNAPLTLKQNLELNQLNRVYIAGQLTGVEGYTESTAMGMWAAMNIYAHLKGDTKAEANPQTMIGALVNYLQTASSENFQPMNANFGLLSPMAGKKIRNKKERRVKQSELALEIWQNQLQKMSWSV